MKYTITNTDNVNMGNTSCKVDIVAYAYSDGTHTVKCVNTNLAGHSLRLTFVYHEGSTEFSSMVIEKTKECARTFDLMHLLVKNGHMFRITVKLS